ncbi:MAG TPA: PIG-L family deacetylase [Chloroflexia bacterium]|nr:PIG-L family deacetylase [Chloroflexia bacterium]
MDVLVIAPHPDDETLGCGGALIRHVERGDDVRAVFLTSGELGLKQMPPDEAWRIRESEALQAAQVLGLADLHFLRCPDWFLSDHIEQAASLLRPLLLQYQPELIYGPHPLEWHPDHKAALPVLNTALHPPYPAAPLIRTYEVWTPLTEFEHVEDITGCMEQKLNAVRCYASQLTELHYDRAIEGLNAYRGEMAAGRPYAEVFASPDLPTK